MAEASIRVSQVKDALAQNGDPWEAGYTSLSSLSLDEQKAYLGVSPPPGERTAEQVAADVESMQGQLSLQAEANVGAPASYDLRDVGGKNYITDIRDQSSCGSCVAFGVVAAIEGQLRVQRNNAALAVDLSEAHLFFCHGRARGRNCSNGWWPNEALDDIKAKGIVDEDCYKYDLSKTACDGLCSNHASRLSFISGYSNVTGKAAEIKQHVATKGPVVACMVVYADFFSYRSGVYRHVTGGQSGGHCITIVGYNDPGKYWICKNSWGKGWGENGFFRIAYGQCGIDSWLNHAVTAIANTGWQRKQHVIGLWAIDQNRNAWAYFKNLGWRKVANDNDNIFFDILTQLIAAKTAGSAVDFYEQNGTIKQVYVF